MINLKNIANSIALKLLIIVFVFLLILIPILQVDSLIFERKARADSVIDDIGNAYAGRQQLIPPIIQVPYQVINEETTTESSKIKKSTKIVESRVINYFFDQMKITSSIKKSSKKRGIYEAHIYQSDIKIEGHILFPKTFEEKYDKIFWEMAVIKFALSDPKGFLEAPIVKFDNKILKMEALSEPGVLSAKLALNEYLGRKIELSITLRIKGTTSFSVAPTAENTQIQIDTDWPHINYSGFLPDKSIIHDNNSTANWELTSVATNAFNYVATAEKFNCDNCYNATVVSFLSPVESYTMSTRMNKYSYLFVLTIFATFLVCEIVKKWKIHPAQYTFVGLSIALFFLTVFSLSEHINFALAYSLGIAISTSMIGFYLKSILNNSRAAFYISLLIVSLYVSLYIILKSEDFALLLGTFLGLALLSAAMYLTRHVDWYKNEIRPVE